MTMVHTVALGMPQGSEWLFLAILGLLFFGKRLPEVGRNLGKGIVEFKKGLKGVEDDVDHAGDASSSGGGDSPKPRFDPYTGKPLAPAHSAGSEV